MADNVTHNRRSLEEDAQTIIGAPFVDQYGNYLGKVKAIDEDCYCIDRSYARFPDLYVPFDLCVYGAKQLKLIISIDEINQRDCQVFNMRNQQ